MRIACDPAKWQHTLSERGVDIRRAKEIFAGVHFTRVDDRLDCDEPRFVTVGMLAEAKAADMPYARRTGDNHVAFRINAIGRG